MPVNFSTFQGKCQNLRDGPLQGTENEAANRVFFSAGLCAFLTLYKAQIKAFTDFLRATRTRPKHRRSAHKGRESTEYCLQGNTRAKRWNLNLSKEKKSDGRWANDATDRYQTAIQAQRLLGQSGCPMPTLSFRPLIPTLKPAPPSPHSLELSGSLALVPTSSHKRYPPNTR